MKNVIRLGASVALMALVVIGNSPAGQALAGSPIGATAAAALVGGLPSCASLWGALGAVAFLGGASVIGAPAAFVALGIGGIGLSIYC